MGSKPLAGKVAIVTGASAGIGTATARALAAEGATVVATARRAERLDALVEEITAAGGSATAAACDVTDRAGVEAVVAEAISGHGGVDILVNNAGVMSLNPMHEPDVDAWTTMVDVNIKGVLHFCGAVIPHMVERGSGHLISVGSVAGRRPFPNAAVYSATKFAVRALAWGMHLELGSAHGLRVTDIQPGYVETELLDSDPETLAIFDKNWEGKKPLEAEDVARTIVFAATSPDHVAISELLIRPADQWT